MGQLISMLHLIIIHATLLLFTECSRLQNSEVLYDKSYTGRSADNNITEENLFLRTKEASLKESFENIDTNKDGFVSEKEMWVFQLLESFFDADTSGNMRLERDEYVKETGGSEKLFDTLDSDNNGELTFHEFITEYKEAFKSFDTDEDHMLNFQEFNLYNEKVDAIADFDYWDEDGDRKISYREIQESSGDDFDNCNTNLEFEEFQDELVSIFKTKDTDQDKELSSDEFQRYLEDKKKFLVETEFEFFDNNQDEKVSRNELFLYDKNDFHDADSDNDMELSLMEYAQISNNDDDYDNNYGDDYDNDKVIRVADEVMFIETDWDGDNRVSYEELIADKEGIFKTADKDDDGHLSLVEYKIFNVLLNRLNAIRIDI